MRSLLIAIGVIVVLVLARSAPEPALPSTIGGLEVMSVGDVLNARALGGLRAQTVAVGGYWTNRSVPHSCPPPMDPPGELEMRCSEGEFGITELNEPILRFDQQWNVTLPTGPHLTPWFPEGLAGASALFNLPFISDQFYAPVPIVVVGHFDDPRSADCRPEARQVCLDRLVVDQIAIFDPASVPTPGITPTPTPFPSPAPAGLFGPEACGGDVAYSFVGWTTTRNLQLPFDRPGHVWAMVTAEPVLLGTGEFEYGPTGSGPRFRWWGRRICIAEEGQPGTMLFDAVPGSSYKELVDGRIIPGDP